MRWTLIAPLAAVTVFAQARPAEPVKPQSTQPKAEVTIPPRPPGAKQQKNDTPASGQVQTPELLKPGARLPGAQRQPCAIPLIKGLTEGPAKVDDEMVIPLPPKDSPQQFAIEKVLPPAPSCDDVKR